jgi:AraC-like DNA-binding protein
MATAGRRLSGDEAAGRAFEARVRGAVAALIADRGANPGVQLIAERLATSVRTLQRRLHASGVTYAGVLQEERCAAARRMLKDRAQAIADVARTLGYSDPAHFTRAFQRWTGSSPSAFRRRR